MSGLTEANRGRTVPVATVVVSVPKVLLGGIYVLEQICYTHKGVGVGAKMVDQA